MLWIGALRFAFEAGFRRGNQIAKKWDFAQTRVRLIPRGQEDQKAAETRVYLKQNDRVKDEIAAILQGKRADNKNGPCWVRKQRESSTHADQRIRWENARFLVAGLLNQPAKRAIFAIPEFRPEFGVLHFNLEKSAHRDAHLLRAA